MKTYRITVHRENGQHIGRVLERSGVTTRAHTLDELVDMLRDAIDALWAERDVQLELVLPPDAARRTPLRRRASSLPRRPPHLQTCADGRFQLAFEVPQGSAAQVDEGLTPRVGGLGQLAAIDDARSRTDGLEFVTDVEEVLGAEAEPLRWLPAEDDAVALVASSEQHARLMPFEIGPEVTSVGRPRLRNLVGHKVPLAQHVGDDGPDRV
jgi:predicted RNase H-like HicB family nuclease